MNMSRRITAGCFSVLVACALPLGQARAETPWAQTLAAQALDSGFLSRLPPNLSVAFGMAKAAQGTEVRQLLARAANRVRTFNVSVANHSDLVIFNVDVRTNDTIAYLVSPDGQLRKAVSYRNVDQARPLSAAEAQAGFLAEQRFWAARARKRPTAKLTTQRLNGSVACAQNHGGPPRRPVLN